MAGTEVLVARYAQAFAAVAASANLNAAAVQGQMREFSGLVQGSRELHEVLINPSIPQEQKLAVLDALAARLGLMREVRNFLAVIVEHERLEELSDIIAAYAQLADEGKGVADAEVVSAFALNADDRRELESQVAKLAGSQVRVTYRMDPALLGGAVVKLGSTVYDGSVKTQLEQLKQTLVNA